MTEDGDIAEARGSVRDGIAAIQNLAHLLRSPRVAPRSIALALPEVRSGCGVLRRAAAALERAIAGEHGVDPKRVAAARAALELTDQRASELEERLRLDGRLETRDRLRLDAEVGAIAAELGTVLALLDLLADKGGRRTATVDLEDVFDESWSGATLPSTAVLLLGGEPGAAAPDREFAGDPRLAAGVLELAVAVVVARRVESPSFGTSRTADGRLAVRVAAAPPASGRAEPAARGAGRRPSSVRVPLRADIPGLAELLPPAARHVGFDVTVEPGRRVVVVTL